MKNLNVITKTILNLLVLIVIVALLYCCVAFSSGTFNFKEWENVGATIFLMQTVLFLTIFVIGYVVNIYVINGKKKE